MGDMSQSREELIKTIRDLVKSPKNYDAFIEAWQAVIASETNPQGKVYGSLSDIDEAAQSATAAIANYEDYIVDGHQRIVPVQTLREPAFVVDANGAIEDLNDVAWQQFGLELGNQIATIDLEFSDRDALAKAIRARAMSNMNETTPTLIQASRGTNNVPTAILLIRVAGHLDARSKVLLVINTGQDAERSSLMLRDSFGLTENETAVLQLFLRGIKLTEIAEKRGRSRQTIRNQMQSVFDKCGCSGQSELMRLALSLSGMLAAFMPVVEEVKRNKRKPISFLRPDGRMVDAVLAGARKGQLVISLPSIFGHPLTPEIEEKLALSGIRMICISRPGMGKSDPVPQDETEADLLASDIAAIMSQLDEKSCILLGRASCAPLVFELANRIPELLRQVFIVNAVVPAPFLDASKISNSWTRSLVEAARNSPSVARLILRSGRRLMRVIGPQKFLMRMYSIAPSDLAALKIDAIVESIEAGAQMVSSQGFAVASKDMVLSLNDWSGDVATCPKQITLINGTDDPNVPINAARRFVDQFPNQCKLVVLEGGGLLSYSHLDDIIRLLKA